MGGCSSAHQALSRGVTRYLYPSSGCCEAQLIKRWELCCLGDLKAFNYVKEGHQAPLGPVWQLLSWLWDEAGLLPDLCRSLELFAASRPAPLPSMLRAPPELPSLACSSYSSADSLISPSVTLIACTGDIFILCK